MPLSSLVWASAALATVLALVWTAQRIVRMAGYAATRPDNGVSRMALVQALPLDPRRRLHLIRCDDRHVLLLTGGNSDTVVGWIEGEMP